MTCLDIATLAEHKDSGRPLLLRRPFPLGFASAAALLLGSSALFAQEITVWSGFPEMEPFYQRVAEGMKAEYPDLVVNVETVPLREHERRLALALPSGAAADVVELAGSSAQRFVQAGLFATAPEDVTEFVTDAANFGEFFLESASHDGDVYGAPLFRGQSAVYYNTAMFEAAGLSAPPSSMAEYTEYAEKLTQRDDQGNPTVSGWSLRLSGGGQGIAEKFWINLFQFGGTVLTQTDDGWVASYDNEAGSQALSQYVDLIHAANTVNPEMPADADAFEREQTAMFIRESWVIGDIASKAPDLPYATGILPRGSIALAVNLYVPSASEESDVAWAYTLAANEPDNLIWLLDNVGWLPNRGGVDYSGVVAAKPALDAFINFPDDYAFFTLPAIGPIEEVLTRLAERLVVAYADPALANNPDGIDAFLAEAAAETNSILEREGILGTE